MKPARMYTKDGSVLMEVSKLGIQGSDVTMRGRVMGTMPTTAYIHPEELLGMVGMVTVKLVVCLPFLLLVGLWRRIRRKPEKKGWG